MTPLSKKGRFYNRSRPEVKPFILRSLGMFIVAFFKKMMSRNYYQNWHVVEKVEEKSISPKITWIGHASFLIQVGGVNILVDPLFEKRTLFFNRFLPPGIPLKKLPSIDAVLLSHNHYDHLSSVSLKFLKEKHAPLFFVPLGDKRLLSEKNGYNVKEMSWWQSFYIDPEQKVRVHFLPAHHWSGRSLFDINQSLWGSWLIEYKGHTIYFAGDTAWDDHFEQIKDQFGSIDIALLPIGPCQPKKWMQNSHLNAEQAGKAAKVLNARSIIPMHWGTFGFGTDGFLLPIERLKAWWQKNKESMKESNLCILKIGQSFKDKK